MIKSKFSLVAILFALVILFGMVHYYTVVRIPVKNELSQLQNIATEYRNKNGNFGVLTNKNDVKNCFSGNTFIKTKGATDVLMSPDVENISCVFKVSTSTDVVEDWSVTIVRKEKAYCEDSTGHRSETPGLTTTHKCDGNI